MKGFPNQVANLAKIVSGFQVLVDQLYSGVDVGDDGLYGRALVFELVAGTGHSPMPPADYLQQQEQKPKSSQSHRTTARGLRELYRLLGLIDGHGHDVRLLPLGEKAASLAATPLTAHSTHFWHTAITNLTQTDAAGTSHPYQVLLRLLARKPGITRSKCALALEAHDDSIDELVRIAGLTDLSDARIVAAIGVTTPTWANASKILPSLAEQFGDTVQDEAGLVYLASLDPKTPRHPQPPETTAPNVPSGNESPPLPRLSRRVTASTIARVSMEGGFDESRPVVEISSTDAIRTARLRRGRLIRHQALVQALAAKLDTVDAELYEDPFDILALLDDVALLVEAKTLSGDNADQRDRVREALAQLSYYETLSAAGLAGNRPLYKVALFEHSISDEHQRFLREFGITVVWLSNDHLAGDALPNGLCLDD
jgi:plasmid maintenance system antidote protein VapI